MSMIFPSRYIEGCSGLAAFTHIRRLAGGSFWFPAAPWRTRSWAGAEEGHPPLRSRGSAEVPFITSKAVYMQPPRVFMPLLFSYVFFSTSVSVLRLGRYGNEAVMVLDKANVAAGTSNCLQVSSEAGLQQLRGTCVRRVPSLVVNKIYD